MRQLPTHEPREKSPIAWTREWGRVREFGGIYSNEGATLADHLNEFLGERDGESGVSNGKTFEDLGYRESLKALWDNLGTTHENVGTLIAHNQGGTDAHRALLEGIVALEDALLITGAKGTVKAIDVVTSLPSHAAEMGLKAIGASDEFAGRVAWVVDHANLMKSGAKAGFKLGAKGLGYGKGTIRQTTTRVPSSSGTFRSSDGRLRNADGTFAKDPTRVKPKSQHGNTAGSQKAYIYEKYDKDGNFLKYGVTQDLKRRYTKEELAGGRLHPIGVGPRRKMLEKERDLVERKPGPDNKEPWAGKRRE